MEALGAGSGGVEAVHQQWLVLIHLRRMQERKCLMLHMPTRAIPFHNKLDDLPLCCCEVRSRVSENIHYM